MQDQRIALLTRTYTVVTATGEPLAILRKTYLHNIIRKRWYVAAPGGEPLAIGDRGLDRAVAAPPRPRSVLRIPPHQLHLRSRGRDAEMFGEFNRKFTLLDRYVLDLSADPGRTFDRRVALALGVMLDSGERR